ncbi:MAG TPA: guanylate kinase [Gammaproteobacteria bacterium]|jgi:guanylate kinase|nr:guanylate kinase [Gammaproteobacteria bacterium]
MPNLFIISAPSGCGKTSLVKRLIEQIEDVSVAVSHTTRDPRPGEVDGVNYFFVSEDRFHQIINDDGFVEYANVYENLYGSAKSTINDLLEKNQDVILEIDWQGARQVRKAFKKAVSIFILPPSIRALRDRLNNRKQDSKSIVEARMNEAISEMEHFNEFDYLVINDDFDVALNDLTKIIHSQRLLLEQQTLHYEDLIKQLI